MESLESQMGLLEDHSIFYIADLGPQGDHLKAQGGYLGPPGGHLRPPGGHPGGHLRCLEGHLIFYIVDLIILCKYTT